MSGVTFIINPNAANGRCGKLWPRVEKKARELFGDIRVLRTERVGHGIELVGEAAAADLIVSVGGDGTHNEVVNGLMRLDKRPELMILSVGTGGDLRKTIGWPEDAMAALEGVARADRRLIDVGHMAYIGLDGARTERWFGNIASFGIGGLVDDMVNRTTKFFGGRISFFAGTLRATLAYRNQPVRIVADGEEVYEGPIYNAAVCNGRYFGGGMMVAPHADPGDGLFDLVIMGDLSLVDTLRLAPKIYQGAHLDMPGIFHLRCREVEVETDSEQVLIDLDGEYPGRMPGRFRVEPEAISMLFPGKR